MSEKAGRAPLARAAREGARKGLHAGGGRGSENDASGEKCPVRAFPYTEGGIEGGGNDRPQLPR